MFLGQNKQKLMIDLVGGVNNGEGTLNQKPSWSQLETAGMKIFDHNLNKWSPRSSISNHFHSAAATITPINTTLPLAASIEAYISLPL